MDGSLPTAGAEFRIRRLLGAVLAGLLSIIVTVIGLAVVAALIRGPTNPPTNAGMDRVGNSLLALSGLAVGGFVSGRIAQGFETPAGLVTRALAAIPLVVLPKGDLLDPGRVSDAAWPLVVVVLAAWVARLSRSVGVRSVREGPSRPEETARSVPSATRIASRS